LTPTPELFKMPVIGWPLAAVVADQIKETNARRMIGSTSPTRAMNVIVTIGTKMTAKTIVIPMTALTVHPTAMIPKTALAI
jgi:hypothetical protein